MSRRFYVAASTARVVEAEAFAKELRQLGHKVVSTWHTGRVGGHPTIPDDASAQAGQDVLEVMYCTDIAVLAAPLGTKITGGGHCTEFGIAIGQYKRLHVVGDRSNIFYHLPNVHVYKDKMEALAAFAVAFAKDNALIGS